MVDCMQAVILPPLTAIHPLTLPLPLHTPVQLEGNPVVANRARPPEGGVVTDVLAFLPKIKDLDGPISWEDKQLAREVGRVVKSSHIGLCIIRL